MKRRDFIQNSVAGIILPAFLNGLSLKAFGNISKAQIGDDHVLVVVRLAGGNDGLNTVIPIDKYDLYRNARSNIAIPKDKILSLSGIENLGINPAMTGFQSLYNNGMGAIIQSVGYPNPNFSHFRATDIWNTGADSTQVLSSGWAGRYLGVTNPNYPVGYPNTQFPDPLSIQIGSTVTTALQGTVNSMGIALSSTANFYNLIQGKDEPTPSTPAGKELKYLRSVAVQSNEYAKTITAAANKVTKQIDYPTKNSLADQLKIVARLIGGGLKTKIYFVSLSGFDTHSNQTNASDTTTGVHANLLQQLSDGIKAFMDDLKGLGVSKNVVGFTYSEFGRRILSNASGGTDHGAAAPIFVFGEKANPVVLGTTPDIAAKPTVNDNIPMQYDFRSVYASILENWFCMDSVGIQSSLLKNYQSLPIILPSACGKVTANEEVFIKEQLITNSPNPFDVYTKITFQSRGGHNLIQIFDTTGSAILTPIDGIFDSGSHEIELNTSNLKSGMYFARFQNGANQQVRKMLKA